MAKRELIDTGRDKRFVRRNKRGQFNHAGDSRRIIVDEDVSAAALARVIGVLERR